MNNNFNDLNLLRIFATLWSERNVTAAAKRLGLSQPALSHTLAKLRSELNDPVFVRSGRGITPTPRAEGWAPKVLVALENLELAFAEAKPFSPRDAKGRIAIVGTDMIETMLFPQLLAILSRDAPDLTLISRPSDGSFPKHDMERGGIDFAIAGFFVDVPEGFYQERIANESYLTIVSKDNPKVKDKLDVKTFAALSHIMNSPQGDLYGVVDKALEKIGATRRVVAGVSTFQVIGKLIAATELCATLPRSMALEQSRIYNLKVFSPPVEIPPIKMHIIWHQRVHNSQIHRWIKGHIESILVKQFK